MSSPVRAATLDSLLGGRTLRVSAANAMPSEPSRQRVCNAGETQRSDMRRHVPAVGKERHRAGRVPDYDFGHHHHRGQQNDDSNAAFSLPWGKIPASNAVVERQISLVHGYPTNCWMPRTMSVVAIANFTEPCDQFALLLNMLPRVITRGISRSVLATKLHV